MAVAATAGKEILPGERGFSSLPALRSRLRRRGAGRRDMVCLVRKVGVNRSKRRFNGSEKRCRKALAAEPEIRCTQ